jgi:hypothetical protein
MSPVFSCPLSHPDGNRELERPRRRWEDNNEIVLREMGCEGVNWICLAHDRDEWLALMITVI